MIAPMIDILGIKPAIAILAGALVIAGLVIWDDWVNERPKRLLREAVYRQHMVECVKYRSERRCDELWRWGVLE